MRKLLGVIFALALITGLAMPVTAAPGDISFTITPGTELSVVVTSSTNFPDRAFSLTGPPNFTDSAAYNYTVTDLRGNGLGWNVQASASAFSPVVPGSGLSSSNNTQWSVPAGYTVALSGSITAGVGFTPSGNNIIATSRKVLFGNPGIVAAVPNATGKFSAQEAVYYTGFPVAAAAGTYSTTVTLTISSGNTP